MAHKTNFQKFIEPEYERCNQVDPGKIREDFQAFMDECMKKVPDDGTPADPYMYNAHMGAFARSLGEAKDHYVKGMLAFYRKRKFNVPGPASSPS